jgi:transcriptional regulator with XRE-family HTH domain
MIRVLPTSSWLKPAYMTKKLSRYIAPKRRRWAFTQEEVAYLLGLKSGSSISRIERGERQATTKIAFAYQALFGVNAAELLPAFYAEVEAALMIRAFKLHERLKANTSKNAQVKRELLESALTRARRRISDQEA